MNAQPPTFMLLPDYSYAPYRNIHLGILLLLSSETKLPDPDVPLNENSRIPPSEAHIVRQREQPWIFDNGRQLHWSGSVDVKVPVFIPAGGGLGFGAGRSQNLSIKCERVDTERFVPSAAYLAQTLNDDFVQDYCRKHWFPSVYLITGIKVAQNAIIKITGKHSQRANVEVTVDATSSGIPLKAGPSVEASNETNRDFATSVEGPFVLAYQLKRLRVRKDGSLKKSESFNRYALFDDSGEHSGSVAPNDFLAQWEMEDVEPSTVHDV